MCMRIYFCWNTALSSMGQNRIRMMIMYYVYVTGMVHMTIYIYWIECIFVLVVVALWVSMWRIGMNTSRKYIIVIISREEQHPFLNIQNNNVLCICDSYGLYGIYIYWTT